MNQRIARKLLKLWIENSMVPEPNGDMTLLGLYRSPYMRERYSMKTLRRANRVYDRWLKRQVEHGKI